MGLGSVINIPDPQHWIKDVKMADMLGTYVVRSKSGLAKSIALDLITNEGLGTLFINVSFNGLLWG